MKAHNSLRGVEGPRLTADGQHRRRVKPAVCAVGHTIGQRRTYSHEMHRSATNTAAVVARIAFEILTTYGKRTPRWQDLADRFGMSRATAYRWVRALRDARGEVSTEPTNWQRPRDKSGQWVRTR